MKLISAPNGIKSTTLTPYLINVLFIVFCFWKLSLQITGCWMLSATKISRWLEKEKVEGYINKDNYLTMIQSKTNSKVIKIYIKIDSIKPSWNMKRSVVSNTIAKYSAKRRRRRKKATSKINKNISCNMVIRFNFSYVVKSNNDT